MKADYNIYNRGEWSVQLPNGDDVIFKTKKEAKEFIKKYKKSIDNDKNL